MTWHFSAQGHITKVLKASPGGGGCKVLEEETCFSHVHYAHLPPTRFFLVFQAIVLACLRPLTGRPWLTVRHQAVNDRNFPSVWVLDMCSCCLAFVVTGSDPRGYHCALDRSYRHWFLGKWREAHFAQMSSMKSQFATWYRVHWTLTAGSWANILPHRMPPTS